MEYQSVSIDHPKRRRRRIAHRSPLLAWLAPSEQFKGNVGRISQELYQKLFEPSHTVEEDADKQSEIRYIAVTPWSPGDLDLVEDASWTILPVQVQADHGDNPNGSDALTIRFPVTSLALQDFVKALQGTSAIKGTPRGSGFEIRVLDVNPLYLDKIYVTVDGDALDKHDEVQKKFGGGFASSRLNGTLSKAKGKSNVLSSGDTMGVGRKAQEDGLKSAIREALSSSMMVRQNDLLPLPLPTHPITHVPLPPARISLCDPVGQGLLSDNTKIIINRVSNAELADRRLPNIAAQKALRSMIMENGYDTSSEHFVSAVEEVENEAASKSDSAQIISDSESSEQNSNSSSDDCMDNVISMNAPQLPLCSSGVLSSRFAATPHPGKLTTNGINTPGSVFSNFTVTTARQAAMGTGKLFRLSGLLGKIPEELLHPKPTIDEDDESRIFVDIKTLLKLGCFSGDWIKLEAASTPENNRSVPWAAGAFDDADSSDEFRAVKVYGLPDLSSATTPRYLKGRALERRSSIVSMPGFESARPVAWLSPILLANLGHAAHARLSPLLAASQEALAYRPTAKKSKMNSSCSPPVARELTILRISTPLSTERALQTGIFTALKRHFETKRRISRQGDIIALPLDTSVSRLLAQPAATLEADHETEELLALSNEEHNSVCSTMNVAWFRIGQVSISASDDDQQQNSPELWGGAACIEPTVTRMRQAGSEASRIPSALDTCWRTYLGLTPPIKSPLYQSIVGQAVCSVPHVYIPPLRRRLRELFAAATSPRAVSLKMDPVVVLLHSTQRNIGKAKLATHAASDLGLHVFEMDAYEIIAEGGSAGDVKTEGIFKARVERAISCGAACTTILVRHMEALSAERMVTALQEVIPDVRILVATTTDVKNIPEGIRSLFTHELEVNAPDEGGREGILRTIIQERGLRLAHDVDLASIAVKTAALVAGNLVDVVERATVARQDRLEQLIYRSRPDTRLIEQLLIRDVLMSGGEGARSILKSDFEIAVEAARKNFADSIGAPKIPNVSWDDVGGLENVKDAVMETIQLPLERPDLFAKGMKKRSGILFYGPPGTGKTLLAKAIATEFSLNFFSVKGPELLNMYIGESEANVRRVFQRARDARPCVVFFDELDSVAPKRGNQGDSGGVMDRIVSQLLAELDGMSDGDEGGGGVFVIGATNRPDLLDQALLRPGRFDKMLYLGVSDTHSKQLTILEALTRKFAMHPETSLVRVAESLPFTYTGADLYALCSDAMLKAITRQANAVDAKIKALPDGPVTTAYFFDHMATDEDIDVMVTEEDFFTANKELVGSVR